MSTVTFESKGRVGILRINRPDALNALNQQVLRELKDLLKDIETKGECRALILTGAGEKAFVAGADIKEMQDHTPGQAREMSVHGQELLRQIERSPLPVIAAVNGFALGGGLELALACDVLLASNKAKWGLPEVTLGLIPGYGGTQRLVRNLGRTLAKRIALSGEIFTAQQGYEWGLFAQLTEPQDLLPTAEKLAETLCARAPLALQWVKQAIDDGQDMVLTDGLALEADLFARTFETKDHVEGIAAFIAKRAPEFKGQ